MKSQASFALTFALGAVALSLEAFGQARVVGTTEVASTRVGRTTFDYSYTVTVANGPTAQTAAQVTVTSDNPATVIVKGTVEVGDLAANATVTSTDVFTFQQDRTQPFDPASLKFSVSSTSVAGSSFDLIDQALAAGKLSLETALEYKVFATFRDPRLPAEFTGDDSTVTESPALDQVYEAWGSLSPAAQQILQPFLMPPAYQGSWRSPAHTAAAAVAAAPADSTWTCNQPVIDPNWASKPVGTSGHFKVWYDTRVAGLATKANAVLTALENDIWPKLITGLGFSEPLSDGAIGGCNGGDGRLDVYLVDFVGQGLVATDLGDTKPVTRWPTSHSPAYILINPNLPPNQTKGALAHEFLHTVQWSYPVATGRLQNDYGWLMESTAQWAIDAVYPVLADDGGAAPLQVEQVKARFYMETPEMPLEQTPSDASRAYGTYLFFQFLAHTVGAHVVPAAWSATTAQTKQLLAVDSAIPGGFKKQWPQFAKLLWNQDPVAVNSFTTWDALTLTPTPLLDRDPTLGGQPQFEYLLDGDIKHLGIHYFKFHFNDANIRSFGFYNHVFAVVKNPEFTVTVQAFFHLQGGIWQYAPWSTALTDGFKQYCFDVTAERLTDLVIVMTNDSPDPTRDITAEVLPQSQWPRISISNVGCWRYKGTTSIDKTVSSAVGSGSSSVNASATFERWQPPQGSRGATGDQIFQVIQGSLTGSSTGTDITGCTTTAKGSGAIPAGLAQGQLEVKLGLDVLGTGGKVSRNVTGTGTSAVPTHTVLACPTGTITSDNPQLWQWLDTPGGANEKPLTVAADGTISGSFTRPNKGAGGAEVMHWQLAPQRQP